LWLDLILRGARPFDTAAAQVRVIPAKQVHPAQRAAA
jgi:hypothetical protein